MSAPYGMLHLRLMMELHAGSVSHATGSAARAAFAPALQPVFGEAILMIARAGSGKPD